MFHSQLALLLEIFQKNGYPENFIDRCFKLFLSRIHILEEKVATVSKEVSSIITSLLQKSVKGVLNCCKS